jgi:hypothetical protein
MFLIHSLGTSYAAAQHRVDVAHDINAPTWRERKRSEREREKERERERARERESKGEGEQERARESKREREQERLVELLRVSQFLFLLDSCVYSSVSIRTCNVYVQVRV